MPENKSEDGSARVTSQTANMAEKVILSESEYRKGAQVISVQMDPAYAPPPTSMNPSATVAPVATPADTSTPVPVSDNGGSSSAETE